MDNIKNNVKISYFSKECFDCLKGYFAICVLIHHIYQFTGLFSDTKLAIIFLNLGYLAVAAFVFISGYGLFESYTNKGIEYLKKFPLKRILSFYFTYCIIAVIYIIFDLIVGLNHSLTDYIKTFTYGSTIISFGWYLQLNLLLYIVFYLIFRFVKISRLRLLLFFIFIIGYSAFYYINNMPVGLYIPTVFFAFGILCSKYKEKLETIISKFGLLLLFINILICAAGFLVVWRYGYLLPSIIEPFIYIVSILSFLLSVIVAVRFFINHFKIVIINPVSKFLGSISLEIYVLQGIVLRLFALFDLNVYIYILLVSFICILIAVPFHLLLSLLQKKIFSK